MRLSILLLACLACNSGTSTTAIDDAFVPFFDVADRPPEPAGCIDVVSSGDHTYTCGTLQVDARIPAACQHSGCGLILELHGDTGTGLLMDGHTRLRALGEANNYIVVAPTGPPFGGQPGSTWSAANDATLVGITNNFASVFHVDPHRIHVTGFSRGAFVTWRLICDHSDLFASAAPGGGGDGTSFGEVTCFSQGRSPTHKIPLLILMGRTDASVGYASLVQIRDAAAADYGASGPTVLAGGDVNASHNQWYSGATGAHFETWDHAYETVADGPFASAKGHCIPGSTSDPYAAQYAIPCQGPTSFVWGEAVMNFFLQNPQPLFPGGGI